MNNQQGYKAELQTKTYAETDRRSMQEEIKRSQRPDSLHKRSLSYRLWLSAFNSLIPQNGL